MIDQLAPAILSVIGHGLWGSALLAGIAAGTIHFIQRFRLVNAATRHAIWGMALVGMVVLHGALIWTAATPAPGPTAAGSTIVGPATEVTQEFPATPELAATAMPPATEVAEQLTATSPAAVTSVSAVAPATRAPFVETVAPAAQVAELDAVVPEAGGAMPLVAHVSDASPSAAGQQIGTHAVRSIELPGFMGPLGLLGGAIWLIGFVAALWRLVLALSHVDILKSRALDLSQELRAGIMRQAGTTRRALSIAVAPVRSPVAAGFRRPAVLLPADLVMGGDQETIEQIALHEVAHLERGDDWALLLQRLVETVLWFNPVVRAVGKRMEAEREEACDEWVVAATQAPGPYARSLGRMIELRLVGGALSASPGLAAQESDIVRRVRRLLERGASASAQGLRAPVAVAFGIILLVVALSVASAPAFRIVWEGPDDAGQVQYASLTDPLPPVPALPPLPPLAPLAPEPAQPAPAVRPPAPVAPVLPSPARMELAPLAPARPPSPVMSEPASLERGVAVAADPSAPADLTVAGWKRWIGIAGTIASSGDRARILLMAAPKLPADRSVHTAYLRAIGGISSSGDRKRALLGYVQAQGSDGADFLGAIGVAATIPSSGDRARTLIAIAEMAPADRTIEAALLEAAESVSGSEDRSRVLRALIN